MRIRDLHILPKLRDGLSYLYLEHGRIEQAQKAVEFIDQNGRTHIPASSLAVLMLGPGTAITHEAVKTLADNGCLVNWCGEQGVRFYAQGVGETRKGYRLIRQAALASDPVKRMEVVRRMYQFRFNVDIDPDLTIEQVRGMEGARVRRAYSETSRIYHVPWLGRRYDRQAWGSGDPINRALSAANACLNGLCHAAIVSAGYTPGLGFIHTGKQLSFVYDIADLYKTITTIPLAFQIVSESPARVETRTRHACRDMFHSKRLLARILDDIDAVLNLTRPMERSVLDIGGLGTSNLDRVEDVAGDVDEDPALPGALWSPDADPPKENPPKGRSLEDEVDFMSDRGTDLGMGQGKGAPGGRNYA